MLVTLTLTFMDVGARAVISLFMRSAMPGNIVVPAPMQSIPCLSTPLLNDSTLDFLKPCLPLSKTAQPQVPVTGSLFS